MHTLRARMHTGRATLARVMSSDDLRLFLAALRAESLAAAAASLGVDRTTIGRRLDELVVSRPTPRGRYPIGIPAR